MIARTGGSKSEKPNTSVRIPRRNQKATGRQNHDTVEQRVSRRFAASHLLAGTTPDVDALQLRKEGPHDASEQHEADRKLPRCQIRDIEPAAPTRRVERL